MRYRVLGPVELITDGGPAAILRPRHRALLAYLLLNANQVVSLDQVLEAMWGGAEPATATSQIHVSMSQLRGALREHGLVDVIQTRPSGYRMVVADGELDADVFTGRVSDARQAADAGSHAEAANLLHAALSVWHGPALSGLSAAYVATARQHLHEQQLAARELLGDAQLSLGRHDAIIPELSRLVEEHPLRERLVCQLMLALHRAGRRSESAAAARAYRDALAEGHGLDPGNRFLALERAVLAGDRTLDGPAPAAPAPAAPPPATAVPAQLPYDSPDFTGRHAELKGLLSGSETAHPPLTVLTGAGGAGKTSLAVYWAHRVRDRFPDGQLFADLRGFDPSGRPLEPLDVLARFLRGLGVDAGRIPADLDEAAALYRSMLADRRVLVVLDNAREAAQVRPLLPGAGSCAVLVTSRHALATLDAHRVEVGGLAEEEAADLLTRYAGSRVTAEPEAARRLLGYCEHLPLAIRVTGAHLAGDPSLTLSAVAARLADERERLDALEVDDLAIRASFASSHRALDPPTAQAFELLGMLRVHHVDQHAAAALWDVPVAEAEATLSRLAAARLVEPDGERVRMHDLMRLFAMERQAARSAQPPLPALRRAAACYLGAAERATELIRPGQNLSPAQELTAGAYPGLVPLPDLAAARSWLERERLNLVGLARQFADAPEPLCHYTLHLQGRMTMFLAGGLHLADWHELCVLSARVARRIGDRGALARALMNLGAIAQRRGALDDAVAHLDEALAISREIGPASTQAAVLSYLASTYTARGAEEQAVACEQEAIALRRQIGDRRSTAHALNNGALNSLALRRWPDAERYLTESIEIRVEEQDRLSAGVTRVLLAGVLLARGEHARADESAAAGIEACREHGDRYNEWIGLLLRSVARRRLGDEDGSHRDAAAGVEVCAQLGQPAAMALCLRQLPPAFPAPELPSGTVGEPVHSWVLRVLDAVAA